MRKFVVTLAVALVLAGCTKQEQTRMQESWDDPMKRLTPRQRTLVEMPATTITIDELVELGEAFPSYATQKLELRIREKVGWDETKSNWDLSQLSGAEQMVWRLEKFAAEIGNGGLSQFFLNKGLWTVQIIKDLEMVECKAVLDWLNSALQGLPVEQLPRDSEQLAVLLDAAQESEAIRNHWHDLDGIWSRSLEGEPGVAVGRYFVQNKELFR